MQKSHWVGVALATLVGATVYAAPASPGLEAIRQEAAQLRQTAEAQLRAQVGDVGLMETAGRVTTVYGRAFGGGASPEVAAGDFSRNYAGLFGIQADQLDTRGPIGSGEHTMPLMVDPNTGQPKFTLVLYTQTKDGVPVFRGDLRLLVRNEAGSPVVLARSTLRPLGDFAAPKAAQDAARADLGRATAQVAHPRLKVFSAARPVIYAGVDEEQTEPRLGLEFTGESGDVASPDGYQKVLFITDAATGEVLFEENQVFTVDVTGNASAMASDGVGADICVPEVVKAMPYAQVSIGATTVYADVSGNFTIPNAGTGQVTVNSPVRGRRFVVTDQSGATTALSQNVTPPGPANFLHNADNTSEFVRASMNAYIQANVVRDFVLTYAPAYPTIANQVDFQVNTNINSTCNAFYSPNTSINFYRAGGGCSNSANADVIWHEYGHHVVQMGGSGQGQYGEGMSDCMGVLISDQPTLGIGFTGNCSAGIRTASNTIQAPCSGAIHTCGQLISGCVWDTRNALIVTNPGTYRDIIANLTINSVPLHGPISTIASDITIDFLTLDDNDANINNGTPHCAEIKAGFGAHSMFPTGIQALAFSYPLGQPNQLVPNQTTNVQMDVTTQCGGVPAAGTGRLNYRIGTSGAFTQVAMSQVGPNSYQGSLPASTCGQTVQYYFTVGLVGGGDLNDPPTAPAALYSALSAYGLNSIVSLDFQNDPPWTVTNTSVTDGPWDATPGVPVNCNRGDPPADYDGSGRCWMTDNSSASSCNSDLDGGPTRLTTEAYDLSATTEPTLSYARWFSNDDNDIDRLTVEISNDNGTNWTLIESVPNTAGWVQKSWRIKDFVPTPGTAVRVRFSATDNPNDSVTEAAIDAFKIIDVVCTAPCGAATGDMNVDTLVNGDDVQTFVSALLGVPTQPQICAGDFNGNNGLDAGDVDGFVLVLLAL